MSCTGPASAAADWMSRSRWAATAVGEHGARRPAASAAAGSRPRPRRRPCSSDRPEHRRADRPRVRRESPAVAGSRTVVVLTHRPTSSTSGRDRAADLRSRDDARPGRRQAIARPRKAPRRSGRRGSLAAQSHAHVVARVAEGAARQEEHPSASTRSAAADPRPARRRARETDRSAGRPDPSRNAGRPRGRRRTGRVRADQA